MKLVAVVGSTASGKSSLALELAERVGGEVVSCDSAAVYRGVDIGTDKLSVDEQRGIPHHLVDVVAPTEVYSAARYAADAAGAIRDISSRGRVPILAGGTGFYYRALVRGMFPGPARDEPLRRRLDRVAARRGVERLHRWLSRVDPPSADRIQARDQKRLVRALEVYLLTGRPLTAHFAATVSPIAGADVLTLGVTLPRDALRERVTRRVESQFARGVVDEVRQLVRAGVPPTAHAFSGLVYRQVVDLLGGVRDDTATRELIVRENMRYAKRQAVWFRREPGVRWLSGPGDSRAVAAEAIQLVEAFLGRPSARVAPKVLEPDRPSPIALSPSPSTPHHLPLTHSVSPTRVILLVLDSVGVGALPDASIYGDEGSDTVGNIARVVGLRVPTLRALGLARVADLGGDRPTPLGAWGRMAEASPGKDSVTGHWEMAGVVLDRAFPTFPLGFPPQLIQEFEERIGRRTLGNCVASGTVIIDQLGPQHLATGRPIVYTSADSVFQIAAHEDVVSIEDLYRICGVAFDLVARGLGVGRVIARPFVGSPGDFRRTTNRRDFALEPFAPTLFDKLEAAGHAVVGIGKIEDLFAGRGLTRAIHTTSDDHGMDVLIAELARTPRGVIAANLVDFDSSYGHRNDVEGYAANLERFDQRLADLLLRLSTGDLLVVTADHGNDPTTPSTDHSREYVPVLLAGAAVRRNVDLGTRSTFADLGQTVADLFDVGPLTHGRSFLGDVLA